MVKLKFYSKKITAQKYLLHSEILCNYNLQKYFICKNYIDFLNIIKQDKTPCYFEYISNEVPVPIFFDIEIYKEKNPNEFNNSNLVIQEIISIIKKFYEN